MNASSLSTRTIKRAALEQRTLLFAANVRLFVRRLPRSVSGCDDVAQLLRSSGSVGANYIEANEAPNQTQFVQRVRLCLKEAKETVYWLKLLDLDDSSPGIEDMRASLAEEGIQLLKIFFFILKQMRKRELKKTAGE